MGGKPEWLGICRWFGMTRWDTAASGRSVLPSGLALLQMFQPE